jgi:hypothetical protein
MEKKRKYLCIFICHNVRCVIQSQIERGLASVFWQDAKQDEPMPEEPVAESVPVESAPRPVAPVRHYVGAGA